MNMLVGTASWTDKSLIASGKFYPPDAKTAEARLRYYARLFPMVEVDSSYYAMPSASTAQLWAERTPADFVFNVKAFRLFTGHATEPKVLHPDLREALPQELASKKKLYYKDLPVTVNVRCPGDTDAGFKPEISEQITKFKVVIDIPWIPEHLCQHLLAIEGKACRICTRTMPIRNINLINFKALYKRQSQVVKRFKHIHPEPLGVRNQFSVIKPVGWYVAR